MDRHVRWFRREIALKLAQRLGIEAGVVCALVVGALVVAEINTPIVILTGASTIPTFIVIRLALSCALNPTSSSYLVRWPRPSGSLSPAEPTNVGSATDIALQAAGFLPRGAFSEWGGATTNLYDDASCTLVLTCHEDDVVVLSGLTDGRLCVTTTYVIPPHERLIVNQERASDVGSVLASHATLLDAIIGQPTIGAVETNAQFIVDLLVLEWDIWDQLGPVFGPFVAVGNRPQPSLLRVRVAAQDVLLRALAAAPPSVSVTYELERAAIDTVVEQPSEDGLAQEIMSILEPPTPLPPVAPVAPEAPATPVAPTAPVAPVPPRRGLSVLAEQARLADERTERALAAGDAQAANRRLFDDVSESPMAKAS